MRCVEHAGVEAELHRQADFEVVPHRRAGSGAVLQRPEEALRILKQV